jgi:type VI secretion system protein ImpH
MASEERPAGAALIDSAAIETARRRGFFPLMFLLERLLPREEEQPERIRFRHHPSMAFTPSEVVEVNETELPADPSDPFAQPRAGLEVVSAFLGLTGSVSPLPQYMAEEIAQEDPDAPAMRDFLDGFHHRFLSFFLRAKLRTDPPGSYRSDQGDRWSRRALAVLGFDADTAGEPAWRLLRIAGLLAEPVVTARALEAAIADVLVDVLGGAPVRVEQFVDNWVELSAADRTRLGENAHVLGRSAVIGERIFDRTGRVRVVLGPVGREGYARFGKRPELIAEVRTLVRALSSGELDHELVLELEPTAAPTLQLMAQGSSRLGRDTWLGRQNRVSRLSLDGNGGL